MLLNVSLGFDASEILLGPGVARVCLSLLEQES